MSTIHHFFASSSLYKKLIGLFQACMGLKKANLVHFIQTMSSFSGVRVTFFSSIVRAEFA